MQLSLLKAQGSQNTFFVIDIRNQSFFTYHVMQKLALLLCDKNGMLNGADGVLYIDKGVASNYQMRIFNADGSEALMCGNGMRIVARWALEDNRSEKIMVENVTELPYNVQFEPNYFDGVQAVRLAFPPAVLDAKEIMNHMEGPFISQPIDGFYESILFSAVAMPNPHIITIVDEIDYEQLEVIGVAANDNKIIFPNGVNVSFVKNMNDNTLFVATYERGVGLTNACGTAMIASCVTAIQIGLMSYNSWITVKNKGGFVKIAIDHSLSAQMIGNATYILEAIIEFDEESIDVYTLLEVTKNTRELEAYEQLLIGL